MTKFSLAVTISRLGMLELFISFAFYAGGFYGFVDGLTLWELVWF